MPSGSPPAMPARAGASHEGPRRLPPAMPARAGASHEGPRRLPPAMPARAGASDDRPPPEPGVPGPAPPQAHASAIPPSLAATLLACPANCGRCDNAHILLWALSQRPQTIRQTEAAVGGRGEPGVAGVADVAGVPVGRPGDAGGLGGVSGALADPGEAISFEVLADPAGVPRARAMLQRAEWAARAFARYDKQ